MSYSDLLTFYNKDAKCIEVWDMFKITQGRVLDSSNFEDVLCLSFTSDNRFLISSHLLGKLNIWSIVDNELYKSYTLCNHSNMIWHSFTPDNQFMVSVFEGNK
jgi:WD40 repeat protein